MYSLSFLFRYHSEQRVSSAATGDPNPERHIPVRGQQPTGNRVEQCHSLEDQIRAHLCHWLHVSHIHQIYQMCPLIANLAVIWLIKALIIEPYFTFVESHPTEPLINCLLMMFGQWYRHKYEPTMCSIIRLILINSFIWR